MTDDEILNILAEAFREADRTNQQELWSAPGLARIALPIVKRLAQALTETEDQNDG